MIDASVYPDLDAPPDKLATDEQRADYVHRICAAWDFGVHPDADTFTMFRGWRDIFDRFPLAKSPAYHAFRESFGWPYGRGQIFRARYEKLDAIEGRIDPCQGMI